MTGRSKDTERRLKRGRNAGIATFGLTVAVCVAVWSYQICVQVWAPAVQPTNPNEAPLSCSDGAKELLKAVVEARILAEGQMTEASALRAFRDSIGKVWSRRPNFSLACQGDPDGLHLLREVDRLRYSEEHAVRYRATNLTRRRRDVARFLPATNHSAVTESAFHQEAKP